MDPPISGDRTGGMVKERHVVCHRLDGLSMLVGMLQDLIACDNATFDLIQDDVPPEFDQSPTFVPGNGPRVRFKEAEDLLLRGDFLALQDSVARLRNHPFHQREDPFSLTAQSRCLSLALLA